MGLPRTATSSDLLHQAIALLESADDESLLAFTEAAVERFPEDSELHLVHALALVPIRPDDARWETARAVQLNPDDPGLLARAARVMLDLGNLESADAYSSRALGFERGASFVFAPDLDNVRGVVDALRGEPELAERELRSAHETDPRRPGFAKDLATFLSEQGRTEEAVLVLDRTIAGGLDTLDSLGKLRRTLALGE